ncbi:MAG: class I tRNA ligase family protein [Candidatus Nitrotoga sp.]
MELDKVFEPKKIEAHWYPLWDKAKNFKAGTSDSKQENFCILLPPPNVTGTPVSYTHPEPTRRG